MPDSALGNEDVQPLFEAIIKIPSLDALKKLLLQPEYEALDVNDMISRLASQNYHQQARWLAAAEERQFSLYGYYLNHNDKELVSYIDELFKNSEEVTPELWAHATCYFASTGNLAKADACRLKLIIKDPDKGYPPMLAGLFQGNHTELAVKKICECAKELDEASLRKLLSTEDVVGEIKLLNKRVRSKEPSGLIIASVVEHLIENKDIDSLERLVAMGMPIYPLWYKESSGSDNQFVVVKGLMERSKLTTKDIERFGWCAASVGNKSLANQCVQEINKNPDIDPKKMIKWVNSGFSAGLVNTLDAYIKQRKEKKDETTSAPKEYFINWLPKFFRNSSSHFFQKSFQQKEAAVNCLTNILTTIALRKTPTINPEELNQHLPTLRNGHLGDVLRKFIKQGLADEIVGKPVTTIRGFIQALEEKYPPAPAPNPR